MIVFDVGANVGQSTAEYLKKFPDAHIYCFEPVTSTFHRLEQTLKGNNRVDCFRVALGSSNSTGEMVLVGTSDMFSLLDQTESASKAGSVATETVTIITLDGFCNTKSINHIDFLKIDTEGFDLDVLGGAEMLLTDQNIDFVQVEAGMNRTNKRHVSFELLKKFFEEKNYYIFGIYEQTSEWPSRQPHLRRTNPVFISERMVELTIRTL